MSANICSQIAPCLFWQEEKPRVGDEFRYLGKLHRIAEFWKEGRGFCYTTEIVS